jgi:PKD repeat protein
LPDGDYTITATATDAGGLVGSLDLPFEVDFRVPGTLTAPEAGAELSGEVSFVVSQTEGVNVERAGFYLPGCGSSYAEDPGEDGKFSVVKDLAACTAGEQTLQTSIYWRDQFNTQHTYSIDTPVTVADSTAPVVTSYSSPQVIALTGPESSESLWFAVRCADGSTVTWDWELKDSEGVVLRALTPSYTRATCGGGNYDSYLYFDGTDAGNFLPDGDYTITATATDAGGLVGSLDLPFEVDFRVPGTLTAPEAGVTLSGRPTFEFVPADGFSGTSEVQIRLQNRYIYVYNASSDGHWRTTYPMGEFDAGAASVSAAVTWRDANNTQHTYQLPDFEVAIDPTSIPLDASIDPTTGEAPLAATLHISTSDPNDQTILIRVDWADGSPVQTYNLASPYGEQTYEHEFAEPGVYNVFVSVSNGAGGYASATIPVTTTGRPNQAPTLGATFTPTSGAAPLDVSVELDGADPDGDDLTYKVDFGDGTDPVTGAYPPAEPIAHTYAQPGTYLAKALVSDGSLSAARTARISAVLPEPVSANAGDDQVGVLGEAVSFDGSSSRPAAVLTSYLWKFGDGSTASGPNPRHIYSSPGRYTVTLTASAGADSDTDEAVVYIVAPEPEKGLFVNVTSGGGGALSGAEVSVIQPDGSRLTSVSDGDGVAVIRGLADGPVTAYVWKDGYRPATASVTVTDGRADVGVALDSGEVGALTLEQREMTIEEIETAGIDVSDPENYHVYEATINLYFVPDEPAAEVPPPQEVSVIITPDYVRCLENCGGGGGGGGGESDPIIYGDHQWIPEVTYVESQPVIQWLVLPMRASWLKEFFEVKLVVQNLTSGFTFENGVASLTLPVGLTLAPTATPQSSTQDMTDVPGGESRTATWVVRGDVEGDYDLSAEYSATVSPLDKTIRLVGRSREPLRVDGASALETKIVVDCRAVRWAPYAFEVRVHNVSTAPVYNFQVEMLDRPADAPPEQADFFYAPFPRQVQGTAEIKPDATFVAKYVVYPGLGNDEVPRLRLVLENSFISRTGGDVDLAPTLESRDNPCSEDPSLPDSSIGPNAGPIRVEISDAGDVATLRWARPTAPDGLTVAGYQLFARQSLRGGEWGLVDGDVSSAADGQEEYAIRATKHAIGRYYAVGTVYSDGTVAFQHQIGIGPARYVALGDSFSAGEGVPEFEPGTAKDVSPIELDDWHPLDTQCHRSAMGSYSRILANDRSFRSALEPATFNACSGAVAADIWSPNGKAENEGVPAQATAVNQFTDVVTLTMGGNDIGFSDIAQMCVVLDCVGQILAGQIVGDNAILDTAAEMWDTGYAAYERIKTVTDSGDDCQNVLAKAVKITKIWCAAAIAKAANRLADQGLIEPDRFASARNIANGRLEDRLVRAYTTIGDRAPHARVYVAGYPQLVDVGGHGKSCDLLLEGDHTMSLGENERTMIYWLVSELNDRIKVAIEEANAVQGWDQVTYVDPATGPFLGRELCRDGQLNHDSGFNSVVNPYFSTPNNYGPVAYSFHPNKYGQEAYAEIFTAALKEDDLHEQVLTFPGGVTDAGEVFVPFGARTLTVTTAIPGSTVTPRIFKPSGVALELDAEGVTFSSTATTTRTVIQDPEPGSWTVRVFGDDVDAAGEPTSVMAFADLESVPGPVASATATDEGGGLVSFDASESQALSGATYAWLFSDGEIASGVTASHRFGAGADQWATLRVTDSTGTSFAGVGIDSPNEPPLAVPDLLATPQGEVLEVSAPGILGNDSDPDGDLIWAQLVSSPAHGEAAVSNNGAITYAPTSDFEGTDSFTYQASDGESTSDIVEVTVTVGSPRAVSSVDLVAPETVGYGADFVVGASVYAEGDPTGDVVLYVDSEETATAPLDSAAAEFRVPAGLGVGDHTLYVAYEGDDAVQPASSDVAQVTVTKETPTVAVSAPETLTFGEPAEVEVAVSGFGAVDGAISIKLGSVELEAVSTLPGSAKFTIPGTTDPGEYLLMASYGGDANHEAAEAEADLEIFPATLESVTVPSISGDAIVGENLSATTGTWTSDPDSIAYQWTRDGVAIDGATEVSYTVVSSDVGSVLAVAVTATKHGYLDASVTSEATATVTIPTTTSLTSAVNPTEIDTVSTFTAKVKGPGGDPVTVGVVTFTDGTTSTTLCVDVPLVGDGSASCEASFENAGTHEVTASYSGDGFHVGSKSKSVEQLVLAAPVVHAEDGTGDASQSVQYSDEIDEVMVTASNPNPDGGVPALSATGVPYGVTFIDNGDGTGALAGVAGVPSGDYTITVTVTTDDGLSLSSNVDVTIHVGVEDAAIALSDDNPPAMEVTSSGGTLDNVTLTGTVAEAVPERNPASAAQPGNIARAGVTMTITPIGPGSPLTAECTPAPAIDGSSGYQSEEVSCTFHDVAVNVYEVALMAGSDADSNEFYSGSAVDAFTVYDPSLGYTTGGGTFMWPSTGERTNFGYVMKYNKKGKNLIGNLLLVRHHADGTTDRVKSNALGGLALGHLPDGSGWASFTGKATFQDASMQEPVGNHVFTTYVEDHGTPGSGADKMWLVVEDGDGEATVVSMPTPATANGSTLAGGNIYVP